MESILLAAQGAINTSLFKRMHCCEDLLAAAADACIGHKPMRLPHVSHDNSLARANFNTTVAFSHACTILSKLEEMRLVHVSHDSSVARA